MGQILANFYLKLYPKDNKLKGAEPKEHIEFFKKFKKIKKVLNPNCTIQFSLLGIRNLLRKAIKPEITFRLTNDCQNETKEVTDKKGNTEQVAILKEHKIKIEEDGDIYNPTHNPVFGQIISFEGVNLLKEPLLWPFIEIIVKEEGKSKSVWSKVVSSGVEECYTTISLLDYTQNLHSSELDVEYAKA